MKYNDLNYVDSKEKKLKIAREETKIDSEIEKKNGEKWLLGFGHFFWADVKDQ